MKLKRYILVSLLLLCGRALACGPGPMVLPDDCDLYRVLPYGAEYKEPDYGRVEANCRAWQRAVGGKVTLEEVRKAVYGFTLADWERVQRGDDCGNAFCRRLLALRDTDAVRLLVWSKYYEQWSEEMRSPWYYGCGSDVSGLDIDTVMMTAADYRGRYTDRYLLLALKCLYRDGLSEECIDLWQRRKGAFSGSHLRDQAEGYVAACHNRMGHREEAIAIYSRLGDAASLLLLLDDKAEVFERVFRHHPNSPFFPVALQRVLFVLENYASEACFAPFALDSLQLNRLLALAERAGNDPRVRNNALWRYTAACLLNHTGHPHEALARVEHLSSPDQCLNTSIRVLRFYLHSQADKIDDDYERRLLKELQWLDKCMQRELRDLDSAGRERVAELDGYGYNYWVYRTVYANDAMRRIVLSAGGLADRLMAAGRAERALQVANMAENRLFQLTDNRQLADRRSLSQDSLYNNHDFSNRFFIRADRMGADPLVAYWKRVERPRDYMDRWLNQRGYTAADYWCDIIGTHLLREMRYDEAVTWLKKVDARYEHILNTRDYMNGDPFSYEERYLPEAERGQYKLRFAEAMAAHEKGARSDADPNDRADHLLSLSIAINNAFSERCWPLVGYAFDGYEVTMEEWYAEWDIPFDNLMSDSYIGAWNYANDAVVPYARRAREQARQLRAEAFATYSDADRKAKGLRRVYEYTYLMEHYANTPTGQDIARRCDEWRDYLKR